jgi:hypothetical protein
LWPSDVSALAGLQAVEGQRQLDADIVGDLRQHVGFLHHRVVFGGGNFGGDRAVDDGADFLGDFADVAAGFHDQRRIGGDAVDQAQVVEFADFVHVGCVDKEFHFTLPSCASRDCPGRSLQSGFPLAQSGGKVTPHGQRFATN